MMAKKIPKRPTMETINSNAAAVDIGSRMHMAAVNSDITDAPIRAFGTFTHDLHDLADWFKSHGVTSIAMESTGVYWIPAYEVLEQHGFDVILVNARYAKNVPGRKTDVSDASWLRQLHSYGLLRGSFRPTAQIATLRAYLRQRERLVEYAAAHICHLAGHCQRQCPERAAHAKSSHGDELAAAPCHVRHYRRDHCPAVEA